jgi:hypothetical protein
MCNNYVGLLHVLGHSYHFIVRFRELVVRVMIRIEPHPNLRMCCISGNSGSRFVKKSDKAVLRV